MLVVGSDELSQLEGATASVELALRPGTPLAVGEGQREFLRLLSIRVTNGAVLPLDEALLQFARIATPQHGVESTGLLRIMGAGGPVLPGGVSGEVTRAIISIVERANPDLASLIGLPDKRQTFERYESVRGVHHRACEALAPFDALQADLDGLLASRRMLARALGDSLVRSYCGTLRLSEVKVGIDTILGKLTRLRNDSGTHASVIFECREAIADQLKFCDDHQNYLVESCYRRFLEAADQAVEKVLQAVRGRFLAPVSARLASGETLQKRYPLREPGRRIEIAIPLRNGGPGIAQNVQVSVEGDIEKLLFAHEELVLGNVSAGEFAAVFEAEVMSPADSLDLLIAVTWDEAGAAAPQRIEFMCTVTAQRCDLPWSRMEYERPYTTEVAKGEQFVGRSDKVIALGAKMLRTPMESFYVTGQKRVGKTSLALAAAEFARSNASEPGIAVKYLLWGMLAHADPQESLKALGESVADFFMSTFPAGAQVARPTFEGSVAGLVQIAEAAAVIRPGLKYVIIFDEFDEIHPELYQHGHLAETFFANIRALTTCDNVCMVLVGGENMPYVMDRQGQKLNKLVKAPLDYFSRDSEWEDFKLLVRQPTMGFLEWHEEAVSEVFNASNGNPFFAKIVCAAVYRDAVRGRDSDVTANEVKSAISSEVAEFDSNAFAHLWQDGIHKPLNDREPDVLRRARTLVLVARAARRHLPMRPTSFSAQKDGIAIQDKELLGTLNEFVKRGVLRENHGLYSFQLPLFELWLIEVGGHRLVSDTLGEELASRAQLAEDKAFVRADELMSLSRAWPTYQGRSIGADDIRAWYEQVDGHQQQRLLFKLLQRVRFFGELELREKLEALYGFIRPSLPEFIQRRRSDRRQDVFITYVDGEGKSGQLFAGRFAETNRLSVKNIIPPSTFSEEVRERALRDSNPSVIVILDDIAATGGSLSKKMSKFVMSNEAALRTANVPVVASVIAATADGEERIRSEMAKLDWLDFDLRFCEMIDDRFTAFPPSGQGWDDVDEMDRAKALCRDIGVSIYPDNPLGFGDQGLLITFATNCPNNSLPILHSPDRGGGCRTWRPLFPRAVH